MESTHGFYLGSPGYFLHDNEQGGITRHVEACNVFPFHQLTQASSAYRCVEASQKEQAP